MALGSPVQAMSVQFLFYISLCPIQPERGKCSVHDNCESVTIASLKVDFRHQLDWIIRIGKIFTDMSMNMFPQKVGMWARKLEWGRPSLNVGTIQ